MAKMFISYHLADNSNVRKIKSKLQEFNTPYYSVPEDADFRGWSHQKISRYILEHMDDCQILLCIVGKETYSRPHVDLEINEALKGGVGNRLGLIVVMLENREDSVNDIDLSTFSNRIQDNMDYALIIQNANFLEYLNFLISEAVSRRNNHKIQVKNNRSCMNLRQGKYYDQ